MTETPEQQIERLKRKYPAAFGLKPTYAPANDNEVNHDR